LKTFPSHRTGLLALDNVCGSEETHFFAILLLLPYSYYIRDILSQHILFVLYYAVCNGFGLAPLSSPRLTSYLPTLRHLLPNITAVDFSRLACAMYNVCCTITDYASAAAVLRLIYIYYYVYLYHTVCIFYITPRVLLSYIPSLAFCYGYAVLLYIWTSIEWRRGMTKRTALLPVPPLLCSVPRYPRLDSAGPRFHRV